VEPNSELFNKKTKRRPASMKKSANVKYSLKAVRKDWRNGWTRPQNDTTRCNFAP